MLQFWQKCKREFVFFYRFLRWFEIRLDKSGCYKFDFCVQLLMQYACRDVQRYPTFAPWRRFVCLQRERASAWLLRDLYVENWTTWLFQCTKVSMWLYWCRNNLRFTASVIELLLIEKQQAIITINQILAYNVRTKSQTKIIDEFV